MNRSHRRKSLLLAGVMLVAARPVIVLAETVPAIEDPIQVFAALRGGHTCSSQEQLTLAVDTTDGVGLEISSDLSGRQLEIRYPMAFRQLTEGWSWRPQANPENEDFYRFKYLPLASTEERRQTYRYEDKLGEPQEIQVRWRYDYFLAFDNLYDFFQRSADDAAGFTARLKMSPEDAEHLPRMTARMAVRGRFAAPCIAESTTFWKATHASPEDFTLKKRYLIGTLDEVIYYDGGSGTILARLRRHSSSPEIAPGQTSNSADRSP